MNIDLFTEELDAALGKFEAPGADQASQVIVDFEVDSLEQLLYLTGQSVLKEPATDDRLAVMRKLLLDSLRVVHAAVRFKYPQAVEGRLDEIFDNQIARMRQIAVDKNNDYSPFNILKAGNLGLATRIGDKISRIVNAVLMGTTLKVNENILETALDMVNYSIFQLMIARDGWVTVEERRRFADYLSRNQGKCMVEFYGPSPGDDSVEICRGWSR